MKINKLKIVFILLFALAIGGYLTYPKFATTLTYANETVESDEAYDQLRKATNLSDAFKHVAKALRPSVVSISTKSKPKNVSVRQFKMPFGFSPFFDDDIFERFQSFEVPRTIPGRQGLGTGMVVRSDGHILTNNHVVKGADEIEVTLSDGRTVSANVVGTDPETDLAILKVEASGLQPVNWGNSDDAEVGEWVVAIGSPFGLDQTVTSGIISAMGRDDMGITSYENFIQTDAAINPGNSGGPLVNLKGEMVGINTAIVSRSGSYNGIGFAIPSSMAERVMNSILDHGQVSRGYLGIMIQDLNDDLASSFGFDGAGVLVGDVIPDGPGDKAGLSAGDIITKLNGTEMTKSSQLRNEVADMEPGSSIELKVYRDGDWSNVRVELGQRDTTQVASWNGTSTGSKQNELGIRVSNITPELKQRFDLTDSNGVVVIDIERNGLAWQLGVRQGDVVLSMDDNDVNSQQEFTNQLGQVDVENGVRLRVLRNSVTRYLFLKKS